MVEGAARRGHDDVRAAIERPDLLLHRGTAVEGDDGEVVPRAYLWMASETCIASSRVGTSTMPAACPEAEPFFVPGSDVVSR
jgi:hypothetical protein